MRLLKCTLLSTLFFILSTNAFSQVKFGGKVNLGTSWISSGNLKDNLEFQKNGDVDIREWSASYIPGLSIGIGGVASYEINSKLSVQGELSFNYQQSRIDIDYLADNRDNAGNGETREINSEAKMNSSRVAIPVTVHYSLGIDKPFILGGLEVNFLSTPQIESTETGVDKEFVNGTEVASQRDAEAFTGDLDIFNNSRLNFLLGAGKHFELAGKKVAIQLTYHLPLTSTDMYNAVNSVAFDDNSSRNNEVFGAFGKIDAEQDAPAFPLNDYRMHFLDFSITYMF